MKGHNNNNNPSTSDEVRRGVRKRLFQVLVLLVIMAVVLFSAAGDLRWPMAWLYFGIYFLLLVANSAILLRKSPEVVAERSQIKEGSQSWDKLPAFIVGLVGPLAILLVAGLDRRLSWSPQLAPSTPISSAVVVTLGYAFAGWAINSNKFFSGIVRIQAELEGYREYAARTRYRLVPGIW